MKKMLIGALALSLVAATAASAQPYSYGQYNQYRAERDAHQRGNGHDRGDRGAHRGWGQEYGASQHQWRRGQRMGYNDWRGAQRVDYRRHHLRHPPQGYEWRESNGQYILGAIATGLIASIILNGR